MFDTIPTVTFSRCTLEALHDLRVIHNLDASQALLDRISLELQTELDDQIISDITTILDSPFTEEITLVGGGRNLWLSEEEMADIRAWSGADVPIEPNQGKVNWKKEGF